MFACDNTFAEQSGLLRSGKRYKRDFDSYSLGQATVSSPVNPEESDSEGNPPVTPQRSSVTLEIPSQSINQPSPSILVAGQSTPVNPPPSNSCPHPNPNRSTMAHLADDIKLPVFKGSGSEDPKQFLFLCEAVWTAKNITDPADRSAQLVTSFSKAERQFFKGPCGKFLNSLSLKIKILLVEKGILLFESDC